MTIGCALPAARSRAGIFGLVFEAEFQRFPIDQQQIKDATGFCSGIFELLAAFETIVFKVCSEAKKILGRKKNAPHLPLIGLYREV